MTADGGHVIDLFDVVTVVQFNPWNVEENCFEIEGTQYHRDLNVVTIDQLIRADDPQSIREIIVFEDGRGMRSVGVFTHDRTQYLLHLHTGEAYPLIPY
jgi:hypothetical protein